jgi:hypothetical protein
MTNDVVRSNSLLLPVCVCLAKGSETVTVLNGCQNSNAKHCLRVLPVMQGANSWMPDSGVTNPLLDRDGLARKESSHAQKDRSSFVFDFSSELKTACIQTC